MWVLLLKYKNYEYEQDKLHCLNHMDVEAEIKRNEEVMRKAYELGRKLVSQEEPR